MLGHSVRPDMLDLFKKAGINWLCLGLKQAIKWLDKALKKADLEMLMSGM